MQNVLLRVTHYERGAERIVSARPVILYIAKRREDEKRERGLHSTSSWSAKMPKAGAGFFPITSTVGKEFFLLGDEGRVVSSAEVETLSGEYPNMKMVGYRLGVCVSSTRTRARCYLMIPFSVASYL